MEWKTFYLFNSMSTVENFHACLRVAKFIGEDLRLFFKSLIEKNSNNNPKLHVFTQSNQHSIRHLMVVFAGVYRAVDDFNDHRQPCSPHMSVI